MKKRMLTIALVATALFAPTNSASADAQSDYKLALQEYQTALVNWNVAMKAEQENFKIAMTNWYAAIKAADQARKEIATNFKNEADAIRVRTIEAVAAASNAKGKKAANAAGKIEMDAAIALRNDSLAAVEKPGMKPAKPKLLPAPTPPAPPAKTAKAPKPIKPSKKPALTKSPTP
jgi:hypothetical protein